MQMPHIGYVSQMLLASQLVLRVGMLCLDGDYKRALFVEKINRLTGKSNIVEILECRDIEK
jgi:hypothetical protein